LCYPHKKPTNPDREILLTIQGRDPVEAMENEESVEEDPLPPPALDNLANIGEEFSATSLCFPSKRVRLTQHCLKDGVCFYTRYYYSRSVPKENNSSSTSMKLSAYSMKPKDKDSPTVSPCCFTS
jgi:hypothetical protein